MANFTREQRTLQPAENMEGNENGCTQITVWPGLWD